MRFTGVIFLVYNKYNKSDNTKQTVDKWGQKKE